MRAVSLRWGLGFGLIAALLGVAALALGTLIEPIQTYTTANAVVFALFVRGMLALFALGVVFGLAYYVGLRIERMRLSLHSHIPNTDAKASASGANDTSGSMIAGGLVVLCYSIVTTIYAYVVPAAPGATAPQPFLSTALGDILRCAIFVLIGAGLGGLGRRAPAARTLLDRIALAPATVRITPVDSDDPSPTATSATSAISATTPPAQPQGNAPLEDAPLEDTPPEDAPPEDAPHKNTGDAPPVEMSASPEN